MITLVHKNGSKITVHGVDAIELLKQGEYVREEDTVIKKKKGVKLKDKPEEDKQLKDKPEDDVGAVIGSALDD